MWGCAYPAGLQAPSAPSMLLLQMAATEAAHANSDEAKQGIESTLCWSESF